ncbi:MAG: TfoX/Sxy family protein [Pseudomonadota bacterium]
MADAVSTIRNLGPKSEAQFARAGIKSADELRSLGADAAYLQLLRSGERPHFIAYYALVMGLQNRAWNDLGDQEKDELRARFDSIVAESRGGLTPDMARALDALGVRLGG